MTFRHGSCELRSRYSVGNKVYNSLRWAIRAWGKTHGVKMIKHSVTRFNGVPTECLFEVFLEAR